MEIDIPLGSYPGRGINVPISLSYSSKLWRMDYVGNYWIGINRGNCGSLNAPKYSEHSASGWTVSLAVPYIEYVGKDDLYNEQGFPYNDKICSPDDPPIERKSYIRRLVVHLPNGETHELRADDAVMTYDLLSACRSNALQSCDPNDPRIQSNWNRTYYAVDGSNIIYVENSVNSNYRLKMPDGSRYDFNPSPEPVEIHGATSRIATRFVDRNEENQITYNGIDSGLIDTRNNSFSVPIGLTVSAPTTAQNPYVYNLPGMTGSYKFHRKLLENALTVF